MRNEAMSSSWTVLSNRKNSRLCCLKRIGRRSHVGKKDIDQRNDGYKIYIHVNENKFLVLIQIVPHILAHGAETSINEYNYSVDGYFASSLRNVLNEL